MSFLPVISMLIAVNWPVTEHLFAMLCQCIDTIGWATERASIKMCSSIKVSRLGEPVQPSVTPQNAS